jgi:hypothetical protein
MFRDYEQTRIPDGRLVDIQHLLVGLDVLSRPEKEALYRHYEDIKGRKVYIGTFYIGTNYTASTWAGDLGSGAADMTLKLDEWWEARNPRIGLGERLLYYFNTRAAEWDLLGDIDAWGIHALRTPKIGAIDMLLSLYYEDTTHENTVIGTQRTLTVKRKDALERFLRHYGFAYEYATDLSSYPVLPRQQRPTIRANTAVHLFGHIWTLFRMFQKKPFRMAVLGGWEDEDKYPKKEDTSEMTKAFLYWLEGQLIENGVEVPYANR